MASETVTPKYPEITIWILRKDNPYWIIGRVRRELRLAGVPKCERDKFFYEAAALMPDLERIVGLASQWTNTLFQKRGWLDD